MEADMRLSLNLKAALCGFFTALTLVSGATGEVLAHGGSHGDVAGGVPTVQSKLPLPKGVRLDILKTNAEQFALATDGSREVEILDPNGQAFIRIQRGQVQANVYAPAWHRAQMPGGGAVPDQLSQVETQLKWVTVAEQTGYGWYDRRLLDEDLTHFTLGLRIDGQRHDIDVVRLEKPKPKGYWRARITEEPKWINLSSILTGQSGQAILMTLTRADDVNDSSALANGVELLDDQSQPFLRLRTQGVWLKTDHPWAKKLNLNVPGSTEAQWVQVSRSPRMHYTDPRLQTAQLDSDPAPNEQTITRTLYVRAIGSNQKQPLQVDLTFQRFKEK